MPSLSQASKLQQSTIYQSLLNRSIRKQKENKLQRQDKPGLLCLAGDPNMSEIVMQTELPDHQVLPYPLLLLQGVNSHLIDSSRCYLHKYSELIVKMFLLVHS